MTDSNEINREEILQDHTQLIHSVVMYCNQPDSAPQLAEMLQLAEKNDWGKLVEAIKSIMSGNRDRSLLQDLDEEESIIIESIFNGIADPNTMPTVPVDLNSDMAAPGIASLIHASMQEGTDSLNIINSLNSQMSDSGGEPAIIAEHIQAMIEGERDLGKLTAELSEPGQKLMLGIFAELTMLEAG